MMAAFSAFAEKLLDILDKRYLFEGADVSLGGRGIHLTRTQDGWQVQLKEERMLGRAATLLEQYADAQPGFSYEETPAYNSLGVMLDCSRNAVPRPEAVRKMLRMLSLMGYNCMQLYMEDVFPLEGYPYFGYGRGGYTRQELKELDAYAASLGIELVPAIQTLAHLGQALKWETMVPMRDIADILLVDDDQTYAFLEAIFQTMRECFRTQRINIGMAEAQQLGLGKYLAQHGYVDRTQLMLRHFRRVHDLALKYDFVTMMWSDMFFRLASGGDYYVKDCHIDPAVKKFLPYEAILIYWDYYTQDADTYNRMLQQHLAMTSHTAFACGAWKWTGFAPCNHFSMSIAPTAHQACLDHGVREVLVTLWGDNGAECSAFAVLPCLQQWAELCWQREQQNLDKRFALCTGGSLEQFLLLDQAVFTPENPAPGTCGVNPAKTLLYEDILTPLFSGGIDLNGYSDHLKQTLQQLKGSRGGQWSTLFGEHIRLCELLLCKCQVQMKLRPAWQQRSRGALASVCDVELPRLCEAIDAFIAALHAQWLLENRPAGLDVLDLRLGGLKQRVFTAQERIRAYLAGTVDTIEELDTALLPYSPIRGSMVYTPHWDRIATPSVMSPV